MIHRKDNSYSHGPSSTMKQTYWHKREKVH